MCIYKIYDFWVYLYNDLTLWGLIFFYWQNGNEGAPLCNSPYPLIKFIQEALEVRVTPSNSEAPNSACRVEGTQ